MRKIIFVVATILLAFSSDRTTVFASSTNLIQGSGPAVYYRADDGKRYVFPNQAIYQTWYPDFSGVRKVSDNELAKTPLAGSVTYRPGARLVKRAGASRVYV